MKRLKRSHAWRALTLLALTGCGCASFGKTEIIPAEVPHELEKVTLPPYRIEPPDILLIEAVRTVPKPPYRIESLDVLSIQLVDGLPDRPLNGLVSVDPDGTLNLGNDYFGNVPVRGLTLAEAKSALETHLQTNGLKAPKISISLAQSRAAQRITGPHLVRQDGTISLGTYGSIRISGMTVLETRKAIESHLSQYLLDPEVSVDVQGYNSKLFYVILDGGGAGQTVYRLPITGSETVLDAISQIAGIAAVSSKDRIWVSRPAPPNCPHQILPVNWVAISEQGDTATNYQLLPGDRVFVAAYPVVTFDNMLARAISPLNRFFGLVLLGNGATRAVGQPYITTGTNSNSIVP